VYHIFADIIFTPPRQALKTWVGVCVV